MEIAEEAAIVYHRFNQLIERIQFKRLQLISGGRPLEQCTPEELIDTHDFMLSMKARYHGSMIPLVGIPWSKVINGVLSIASSALNGKTRTSLKQLPRKNLGSLKFHCDWEFESTFFER